MPLQLTLRASSSAPPAASESAPLALLAGSRWLVVDSESVAADAIACRLREHGCVVRLIDPAGSYLPRLEAFDAQIVLTHDAQDIRFLRDRMLMHPGLRWASPVRHPWPELWPRGLRTPDLAPLALRAKPLLAQDQALCELARIGPRRFSAPTEQLGPVRTLRALCTANDVFRVSLSTPDHQARVELAGNLILGATFQAKEGDAFVGARAFAYALELCGASATVERGVRPETPTFVAPLDDALELAMHELRERRSEEDGSPTLRMRSPLALRQAALRESDQHQLEDAEPSGGEAEQSPEGGTRLVEVDAPSAQPFGEERVSGVVLSAKSAPMVMPALSHLVPTARTILAPPRNPWPVLIVGTLAVLLAALVGLRHARHTREERTAASAGSRRVAKGQPAAQSAAARALPSPNLAIPRVDVPPPHTELVHPEPRSERVPSSRAMSDALIAKAKLESTGDGATALLQQALEHEPLNPHAMALFAQRALAQGDADTAQHWAERAVSLRQRRAPYRVLYGDALLLKGARALALAEYRVAQQLEPHSKAIRARIERLTE